MKCTSPTRTPDKTNDGDHPRVDMVPDKHGSDLRLARASLTGGSDQGVALQEGTQRALVSPVTTLVVRRVLIARRPLYQLDEIRHAEIQRQSLLTITYERLYQQTVLLI